MPEEFDCPDCGWHIVNVIGGILSTERCLTCQHIADQPEADRPRLRAILCSPPPGRVPARAVMPAANDGGGASDSAAPGCLS